MPRFLLALAVALCGASLLMAPAGMSKEPVRSGLPPTLSKESQDCIKCHVEDTKIIYQQWGKSHHYRANVGCYECHQAQKGESDAFQHEGHLISVIVSPKDCARCHEKEVDEFANSHHSKAGRIIGSLDNFLAEVVEGNRAFKTEGFPKGISAAAVMGCWQCHGSVVKVVGKGALDPATWPNTGIGRVNPDGSEGSCSACHQRHTFSVAVARAPENCARCHMGPDHPQKEIYEESKHGIAFRAFQAQMNLDAPKWVLGEDYDAAPTCATCHMSATPQQAVTHNVGLRIKWNNRPVVSVPSHLTDAKWGLASAAITADRRKENMKDVCTMCHNDNYVEAFYEQYEALIALYNEKYAKPGAALHKQATAVLKAVKGSRYASFANAIDFTWFELWHHEGRRARHAASMQGPDYTHWHGTYELARNFYSRFVPELEAVIAEGRASGDPAAKKAADALERTLESVLDSPDHYWSIGKEDPAEKAERDKRAKEFQSRYQK